MATRGRKVELSRVGEDRGDRTPPGELVSIKRPDELNPASHEIWEIVVPYLCKSKALVTADLPLLIELVEAMALAKTYREALWRGIDKGASIEHDRDGNPYEVPFIGSPTEKRMRSAYKTALDSAEKLASEFGATPTARARLGLTTSVTQDLMAVLRGDDSPK